MYKSPVLPAPNYDTTTWFPDSNPTEVDMCGTRSPGHMRQPQASDPLQRGNGTVTFCQGPTVVSTCTCAWYDLQL